jgi:glycosyltransferase involved in cell wall biosynthesis
MNLSVCIIAKNEEKHIEKCMQCLSDKEVQIVVADTGSTDKTKEIAKKYTEFVYDFKWIDDFGAAKQFAVSKASNDNILILDCDEYLQSDKTVLEKLNSMLENEPQRAGRIKCINVLVDGSKNTDWITRALL